MRRLALLAAGLALLAGVAAAVSGGATQARTRWAITDLGTLGGNTSKAVAINNRDQIVGASETKKMTGDGRPISHGFFWQNGKLIDLGTLGGNGSRPVAINERGQVIGTSLTRTGDLHAFLWEKAEKAKMRDLGTLGGSQSFAAAINARGQVVGWSVTKSGKKHACLWERGKIRDLGTLGGASAAVAVNDRGQIVGWSESETRGKNWSLRVVLWENRKIRDLGLLGIREAAFPSGWNEISGEVVGINARSEVLWNTKDWSGVLWKDGRVTRIPYKAVAMNDLGWVIGEGDAFGTLWRSGHLTELSFNPEAINNHGLIAGWRWGRTSGPYISAIAWHGERTFLPTLGAGQRISRASAVNGHDSIVGESEYHAVLWMLKRG